MSQRGDWIANCPPDRVERIAQASIYRLEVGPPVPNQQQTLEDLKDQGLVGLYRQEKKSTQETSKGQRSYLEQSPFGPSPTALRGYLGPLGPGE